MSANDDLIPRATKRLDWAARALLASAEELRDAGPIAGELAAEAQRVASLKDGIAGLERDAGARRGAWGR
ncbi:MAG TPA: hypothetical protein VMI13_01065 [Solirubrobacteraceae bacterium]|nr:hypothetical protein [Solirubrobacteraceae bacterium]